MDGDVMTDEGPCLINYPKTRCSCMRPIDHTGAHECDCGFWWTENKKGFGHLNPPSKEIKDAKST